MKPAHNLMVTEKWTSLNLAHELVDLISYTQKNGQVLRKLANELVDSISYVHSKMDNSKLAHGLVDLISYIHRKVDTP